jgi:hypothetical protein
LKSPYTHMSGRNVQRLDLVLLDGLSHCKAPASTDAVMQISDPRGFANLDLESVIHELTLMIAEGFVVRSESPAFHDRLAWAITDKGRAHLIASETRGVIDDVASHTPIRTAKVSEKPRIEEVPEMDLNARLRASHAKLDREGVAQVSVCNAKVPKLPPVATVCVTGEELDDWWSSLDVSSKGIAFTEYSLINAAPLTAGESFRIPLVGTAGDLSPETLDAIGQVAQAAARDPFQVGGIK